MLKWPSSIAEGSMWAGKAIVYCSVLLWQIVGLEASSVVSTMETGHPLLYIFPQTSPLANTT